MITFCTDTAPNLSHVSVKPEDVSLPYQVQKTLSVKAYTVNPTI